MLFRARAEDRKRHAREMKELKAGAEAQARPSCMPKHLLSSNMLFILQCDI